MRTWVLVIALVLVAGSVRAQSREGSGALALGAIIGGDSPLLSRSQKAELAQLFEGDGASVAGAGAIGVTADAILCRAGNVAISAFACDLTFGAAQTVHLTGRSAHELFATLASIGVAPNGAMGTTYEALYKISCTIDPNAVSQAAGGGAECTYALNQS